MDEGDVGALWAGTPLSGWGTCLQQPRPKAAFAGMKEPIPSARGRPGFP